VAHRGFCIDGREKCCDVHCKDLKEWAVVV
jgi:hypothetical protein